MNILMLSHEYPPIGGGGANACMHLAKEYKEAGNEVTIVTVWYEGLKEHEDLGGISIYRVRSKRNHMEHCSFMEMADFLVKAMPVADRLAKEGNFDICQVFFGIPSGPLGYRLKKKYKLPYVIRFGGGDIPGFQDRFSFVYKLISPFIKTLWKDADALVANSVGLKKMAMDFYDKKDILVIPNGADPGEISEKPKPSKDIKLLFVSRLIERKGLQDILPQLGNVFDACSGQGTDITLDVVGDGPYRETLEQMVRTEGIEERVIFHGQKSKAELPEFYSGADIFIFPSRKEGMPNVVLEAMSYGLPVLMTACQGSDELIDGNGMVIAASEFGAEIKKLALDEELRRQMGAESLRLIKERFSWKNTADKYLELFGQIRR